MLDKWDCWCGAEDNIGHTACGGCGGERSSHAGVRAALSTDPDQPGPLIIPVAREDEHASRIPQAAVASLHAKYAALDEWAQLAHWVLCNVNAQMSHKVREGTQLNVRWFAESAPGDPITDNAVRALKENLAYIWWTPERHHGDPCIGGTRIPTDIVRQCVALGEDPLKTWPHLTQAQVDLALEWELRTPSTEVRAPHATDPDQPGPPQSVATGGERCETCKGKRVVADLVRYSDLTKHPDGIGPCPDCTPLPPQAAVASLRAALRQIQRDAEVAAGGPSRGALGGEYLDGYINGLEQAALHATAALTLLHKESTMKQDAPNVSQEMQVVPDSDAPRCRGAGQFIRARRKIVPSYEDCPGCPDCKETPDA